MIPCLCLYAGLFISFFRYSFSYLDSIIVPKSNFRSIHIFQIWSYSSAQGISPGPKLTKYPKLRKNHSTHVGQRLKKQLLYPAK